MRFSGHETFVCKQPWLKKGYDFLNQRNKFTSDTAVIDLGVGKNMVSSIAYWMKAFDLCDDKWELSYLSNYLFGEDGRDSYLEDYGTLWLLHYHLVKSDYASIYNLFFNGFRKTNTLSFTESQLHGYLQKEAEQNNIYNENTISNDISVFRRMYTKPQDEQGDIEDIYSSIFSELSLLTRTTIHEGNKALLRYNIPYENRANLPSEIVLYSILDKYEYKENISINFNDLISSYNSPGMIFSLSKEGLYSIIEDIEKNNSNILFSSTAGLQTLQINKHIDKWSVLSNYYDK